MLITEVRATDEAVLRSWHEVYAESHRHGRPYAYPWRFDEVRVELLGGTRRRLLKVYAGLVDGDVVCAGHIGMPMLDNLHAATLAVGTAVAHRGRGHGSAMLEHLVDVGRAHGRTTLFAEVSYPYDAPADGHGEPGPDFVTARGFAFALGDVHRVLELPVDEGALSALAAEAAQRHAGYRLEAWSGPVPEKWLASYVALDAQVSTDAPTGDLLIDAQSVNVDAYREMEALFAAQGRTVHAAVALDADDQVVAYTAVGVPSHEPGRCYQWGTLVDRAHRGHRLGLAVKVANLQHLQRTEPSLRSMTTFNAESNSHMVQINDRLGFRPVERLGEFQRHL